MTQRKPLLAIALVIAVLTGSLHKSASLAAAESLDLNTFLNQDLRKADSNHVAKLVGFLDAQSTNKHKFRWSQQPWFVWKLEDKSLTGCFVVFEGQPIFMTPGTSSAVVHLFDPAAKHLTSSAFSTGWRIDLKTASLLEEPSLGAQVIELRTEPTRPTQNIPRRQIYGLVGHRVALIRLEGSQGELFGNTYIYPNQTLGPPPPPRTADQWEAALKSNNYIETLEALMWLGGRHLDAFDASEMRLVSGVNHENVSDAKLFAEVRGRQSVQKVLDSLAESKINWISAAAKLAKRKGPRP